MDGVFVSGSIKCTGYYLLLGVVTSTPFNIQEFPTFEPLLEGVRGDDLHLELQEMTDPDFLILLLETFGPEMHLCHTWAQGWICEF